MNEGDIVTTDAEHGIKEIGEAIEGGMILSLIMFQVGHDGFQFKDFNTFWQEMNKPENQEKLKEAWKDVHKARVEGANLSVDEVFTLAYQRVMPYIPKFIGVFKK